MRVCSIRLVVEGRGVVDEGEVGEAIRRLESQRKTPKKAVSPISLVRSLTL
jgi:hypothetical protein